MGLSAFTFTNPAPFKYERGGFFLGLDADGNEIGIKTDVHLLTLGGSGAGKGTSLIVPNAIRWPHNLLLIDPKGENARLAWKHREALGQKVGVIDPFFQIPKGEIPDRLRVSINPLASIDPAHPRARAAIAAIANGMVISHNPQHEEWAEGARSLLAGLCAFVVADAPPQHRTMGKVRALLQQKDEALKATAEIMAEDTRLGGLIRSAGLALLTGLSSRDKSMERDFIGTVRRATQWLDDEAVQASLSHSNFDLSDLKSGDATLFLVLPPDYINAYAGFLRLFVKTALHTMGTSESGKRCLFLLDEFYSLGRLDELSEAAGRMRSYGVHLWPFLQGLGQLQELYGKEGAQTFLTNAAAHIFLGNDADDFTLNYIVKRLSTNPPLTIREVAKIVGKESGAAVASSMIVFKSSGEVLRLAPAPYFEKSPAFAHVREGTANNWNFDERKPQIRIHWGWNAALSIGAALLATVFIYSGWWGLPFWWCAGLFLGTTYLVAQVIQDMVAVV